jgi:quercetin dioxygenase-like cupin family protein
VTHTGYQVARFDELEAFPVDQEGLTWRPIRRRFGISSFGVNAYTAERAGDRVVEEHTESGNGHEEAYVVVSGRATFTVGGEEIDAPAGTVVFLPDPDVRRGAMAAEAETTVLALGAKPGAVHQPSAWETFFAAYGYDKLGETERGHRLLREAVEREPDRAVFRYHLACFEAKAGHRDDALAELRRAVELDPEVAEWAAKDSDFDAVRDDPRFPTAGRTGSE